MDKSLSWDPLSLGMGVLLGLGFTIPICRVRSGFTSCMASSTTNGRASLAMARRGHVCRRVDFNRYPLRYISSIPSRPHPLQCLYCITYPSMQNIIVVISWNILWGTVHKERGARWVLSKATPPFCAPVPDSADIHPSPVPSVKSSRWLPFPMKLPSCFGGSSPKSSSEKYVLEVLSTSPGMAPSSLLGHLTTTKYFTRLVRHLWTDFNTSFLIPFYFPWKCTEKPVVECSS